MIEDLRFTEMELKIYVRHRTNMTKEDKDTLTLEIGKAFTEIIRCVKYEGWGFNDIRRYFAENCSNLPLHVAG